MTPATFHVLAQPTGAICYIDCTYCLFLAKEARHAGSRVRLAESTLEAYIRRLMDAQTAPHIAIAWQGGEPTVMGLDFFREVAALVQQCALPGTTVEHTIETNGALLDEAWCTFFRENRFLVSLAIDGPRRLHDTARAGKTGYRTFDRVMAAAALLRQRRVKFNVVCPVHTANADYPLEVYRFLRDDLKSRYMQFVPIVERTTPVLRQIANLAWSDRAEHPHSATDFSVVSDRTVRPGQWGRFLTTIFDEWMQRDIGKVFVQTFDAALIAWLGLPPPVCSSDVARNALPKYCIECPVRFACQGGLPGHRFATTADGEPGLNYLCTGYKAFFAHIDRPMRLMADRLRAAGCGDHMLPTVAIEGGLA